MRGACDLFACMVGAEEDDPRCYDCPIEPIARQQVAGDGGEADGDAGLDLVGATRSPQPAMGAVAGAAAGDGRNSRPLSAPRAVRVAAVSHAATSKA